MRYTALILFQVHVQVIILYPQNRVVLVQNIWFWYRIYIMLCESRREGKRIIYETAFICHAVATVLLFIVFCTPYWIVSWPRVHSSFKRMGLWEACFAGMVLPMDPSQKSYHGCWWILAPEYTPIRSWLMPGVYLLVSTIF